MNLLSNRIVRSLITVVAAANIVFMMVFQYGLPSQAASDDKKNVDQGNAEEVNVGTIEAVQQETAAKEEAAAETALAREEIEEPEEEEEPDRDPDAPVLELTDEHIYLHVGERFNYMSYIKTMQDVDGSDLSHYINLDKFVDTSVPGEIELTYRITSIITGKSDSEVLLITITE